MIIRSLKSYLRGWEYPGKAVVHSPPPMELPIPFCKRTLAVSTNFAGKASLSQFSGAETATRHQRLPFRPSKFSLSKSKFTLGLLSRRSCIEKAQLKATIFQDRPENHCLWNLPQGRQCKSFWAYRSRIREFRGFDRVACPTGGSALTSRSFCLG